MVRSFQRILVALVAAGTVGSASAFSLLGPSADFGGTASWQVAALGYNLGGIDIGGPMNLGEGYRWNIKTITYGFTKSFQDYFGQRGIDEVNKAVSILNNLPPVSKMSSNLTEFPLDARRINYQANSLGLIDLKTVALGYLIEESGLADAERYTWTLRSRFVTPAPVTNYFVIMRNFDPVTWVPSAYVNGILYSYFIVEGTVPAQFADAQEFTVDPLAIGFNTVAGIVDSGNTAPSSYYTAGVYYTGLTRDDVGGIRYLLSKKNFAVEGLPTNAVVAAGGGGGAWGPAGSGGVPVNVALRGGADKITFKQSKAYAFPIGMTNFYTDVFYTNGHAVKQRIELDTLRPDILFDCGDLPLDQASGRPFLNIRSDSSTWANNSAINTPVVTGVILGGPGVIQPTVVIAFSNIGPFNENVFPGFLTQANRAGFFGGWAAIDGTTNAPFIFPNGVSIQTLQDFIFSGGH